MSDSQTKPGLGDLDVFANGPAPLQELPAPVPYRPDTSPHKKDTAPNPDASPKVSVNNKPARRHRVATRSKVFYLADDQIARLKKLSQQTERSESDLAREAISEYLDKST